MEFPGVIKELPGIFGLKPQLKISEWCEGSSTKNFHNQQILDVKWVGGLCKSVKKMETVTKFFVFLDYFESSSENLQRKEMVSADVIANVRQV